MLQALGLPEPDQGEFQKGADSIMLLLVAGSTVARVRHERILSPRWRRFPRCLFGKFADRFFVLIHHLRKGVLRFQGLIELDQSMCALRNILRT